MYPWGMGTPICIAVLWLNVWMTVSATAREGSVRIVDGPTSYEGRVEVFYNNTWGTICNDYFNDTTVAVICRQLGFFGVYHMAVNSTLGTGTGPVWLDDVRCSGSETHISDCSHTPWGSNKCLHSQDANVACDASIAQERTVRLVDGPSSTQGRVEIFYGGRWGTICDDNFDNVEAKVVCKQLGLYGFSAGFDKAKFGQGNGTIWLDDVRCSGSQTHISDCFHRLWGLNNCGHGEDASVACFAEDAQDGSVRLVDGPSVSEGRVEIFFNGTWGTICGDRYFNHEAATVVCRQLGFNGLTIAYKNAVYGEGNGTVWLGGVRCSGRETDIADCRHYQLGSSTCPHSEDAGVFCDSANATNEGSVRLVDGPTNSAGRVEVFYTGMWGTICDSSFDDQDASVICRQLGFSGYSKAYGNALFGEGNGTVWLNYLGCSGSESYITDCYHSSWGSSCWHYDDASVVCGASKSTEGTIRLVDGKTSLEGRLEIVHYSLWGSVCGNDFSNATADVVCRQLGFYHSESYWESSTVFGEGNGTVWLDEVRCSGGESSITNCQHLPWGAHNCTHSEDVGIVCTDDSKEGNVRLVGGNSTSKGRVEIFHNGTWGTICDDSFGQQEASVICRQLGYFGSASAYGNANFGQGAGKIWLDDLRCTGPENKISDCSHPTWGSNDCGHSEDASVSCYRAGEGSVRLVDGVDATEGRVEILHQGTWGTICDDTFTYIEASVICRELGYVGQRQAAPTTTFGPGTGPIWLEELNCRGHENRLSYCGHQSWGSSNCSHYDDAGVFCNYAKEGNVRLVGGNSTSKGRVEIFHNGTWGTICDDSFGQQEASVICRQLGYFGSASAYGNANFGQGAGRIWLDDLRCTGTENKISDCSHPTWGSNNCGHSEDASVSCYIAKEGNVRLVGGNSTSKGRVEIFHSGTWGTICDDSFGQQEASVICRQLGYFGSASAYGNANFGQGAGRIWLDDLRCTGTENKISDCSHPTWGSNNCGHSEDASVSCYRAGEGSVRLVDGVDATEGRVEILHQGTWGTICDDSFTYREASVVCRELGYVGQLQAAPTTTFGPGTGQIWLEEVICQGGESGLRYCRHQSWGSSNCSHYNDAGVLCNYRGSPTAYTTNNYYQSTYTNTQYAPLRLVNGTRPSEGRVEVFHNGVWGTICDDYFDRNAAIVVCRQLGYSWGSRVSYYHSATFGGGSGPIWMNSLSCTGTETSIAQCGVFNGWGYHGCGHNEDAGVDCDSGGSTTEYTTSNYYQTTYTNTQYAPLRLVNGTWPHEGRVEVFHNGVWGTICDHNFHLNAAIVVCRQLGYSGSRVSYYHNAKFGKGSGPIWLEYFSCTGAETSIAQCQLNRGWGQHDCDHDLDAGVNCDSATWTSPSWYTTNGYFQSTDSGVEYAPVRLINGYRSSEGRVEVYHNGVWGTICDDNFNISAAIVVCRQLGYLGTQINFYPSARYGPGSGPIWLDGFGCSGGESNIAQCRVQPWSQNDCQHTEDASVNCDTATSTASTSYTTHGSFQTTFSSIDLQRMVTLKCEPERWNVVLDKNNFVSMFGRSDLSHIYLSNAFCSGKVEGNTVVFNYSYTECRTHVSVVGSDHVFQNYLVEYEIDPQTGYADRVLWHHDLTCIRPSKEIEHMKFAPIDFSSVHVSTSSKVKGHQASIGFYKDSGFTEKMAEPLQLKVGSRVYVEVMTQIHENVKLIVNNCFISPDRVGQQSNITLIQNRCASNHFVHMIGRSDKVTRFYYDVLEIPHQQNNIYINCEISFCNPFDFSSSCRNGCYNSDP